MAASTSAFTGKVAVVTGGARGIGRGLVEQLLSRGATVVATARSASAARERLQPLLEQKGGAGGAGGARLHVDELDVTDEGSVRAWAAGLRGRFERVDLLVNNSGIYSPDGRRPKLGEFTQADFTPVFLTNAVGPFLVTQALLSAGALGGAAAAGAGAGAGTPPARSVVANVSSVMASHGDTAVSAVTPGGYSYRASKAALNIISTTMASDFARDGLAVDVVCLHPGYTQTDMTGGQGWITVEQSAAGMMAVLEDGVAGRRPLNGKWYAYDGAEIPW